MNFAQQIVVLVLGGGGAAAIFTLVKAFLAVRGSADTREAAAIGNLEKWRVQADQRADAAYTDLMFERQLVTFWQHRAAEVEHAARLAGCPIPPCPPPPTRQQAAT